MNVKYKDVKTKFVYKGNFLPKIYNNFLNNPGWWRIKKTFCHNRFFNTFQAQLIAQSIGQAFQVAYMEFLKANGIEDPSLMKEIDYQEVLNQQEIYGEELNLFSNKERQKEVQILTKLPSSWFFQFLGNHVIVILLC